VKLKRRRDKLLGNFLGINPIYLVAGVVFIDQTTKILAERVFPIVCNGGVAFGIRAGGSVLSAVVLIILLFLLKFEKKRENLTVLVLIFAGGLSNFVDRIIFGCVRDFINFGIFPIFNFADVAVTLGVALFVYLVFWGKHEKA